METVHEFQPRYDAVVVGARCAGAAAAFLLARAGAKVLLIDRQQYGSDTMSTHALMRAGVIQLHRWGLLEAVMAEATPEVRSTSFHYGSEVLRIGMKAEHGVEYLCAPRRTVLDRVLVDAARGAGADVRHGVVLSDLRFNSAGRVMGAHFRDADGRENVVRCEMLIGADGRQSSVARLVGAAIYHESGSASGSVYGYFENLDREGFHWHFAHGAAASIIPTSNAQHCVAVSVPEASFPAVFRGNVEPGFFRMLAANSPQLEADVRQARLVGRLRGFPGARGFFRQPHGPGWALVGDAGYFKDPLTAHGITDALRDAELLVGAVLEGRAHALEAYRQERDALSMPLFEVTDAIASFHWDLDQVRRLHTRLSAAMKAEIEHAANGAAFETIAA